MPLRLVLISLLLTACSSEPPLNVVFHGDLSVPYPEGGLLDLALPDAAPGDLSPQEDPDLARPADLVPAYPPGPYGNQVGDTLADVVFSGYRLDPAHTDSSKLPWSVDISLGEYHRNPACKCLIIDWCAAWVAPCRVQQPSLIADVTAYPSYCVLEILLEGQQAGANATMQDVSAWTQQFRQNFFVVQGNNASLALFKGWGAIGLPFALVVKPSTMKVLGSMPGFSPHDHDRATMLCK